MLKTRYSFCFAVVFLSITAASPVLADNPRVDIQTSYGDIIVELYPDKAPLTVANFLRYVDDGFYSGTVFHRVIKNFMIQGGGFDEDLKQKPTRAPIKNEANSGLSNARGTVAMARTGDPDSATAQFFINTSTNGNTFLDFTAPTVRGWGYSVFGKVVKGMDVVDEIESAPTGPAGPFDKDAPQGLIVIEKISRVKTPSESASTKGK